VTDENLERLVAEIPSELKELVDADPRTNKEIVEASLWREFGGERKAALDRRIEEKERRVSMIESEKNERERELKQERTELEALRTKREKKQSERERKLESAITQLTPESWLSSVPRGEQIPSPNSQEVQDLASDMDVTAEELHNEVVAAVMEDTE
jgi:chromosome segregation ATPase